MSNIEFNLGEGVKGMIFKLDAAGRIVIPSKYRKELGIDYYGAPVEVFLVQGGVLIRPASANE